MILKITAFVLCLTSVASLASPASAADKGSEVRVGSKAFTEGFILAELASQKIESVTHETVARKFGLGNTGILFEALKKGEIDLYPEYTGTIGEAILKDPRVKDLQTLQMRLNPLGLVVSESLGFNNTYALAVTRKFASRNQLATIGDLKKVQSEIRSAFSHEFVSRADGLAALSKRYELDLSQNRQSLEHSLAYQAVADGKADLIDVYSTDPKIKRLDLVVLTDDKNYFPRYEAVFLARADFVKANPQAWASLRDLAGTLTEEKVMDLNSQAEVDKKSFKKIVADYFSTGSKEEAGVATTEASDLAFRIWVRTKEHLVLVGITLALSTLVGIPLGILAANRQRLGQFLLLMSSVVQTIPSLALLCFLIPIFGIGLIPALVALFLYSLLPILLNTYVGLKAVDHTLIETAQALGLSRFERLMSIELPIASPNILAGVKTSLIISIGTATLAALIGAGGYGAPIVSGLAINDMNTILTGAIPASVMSLVAYFAFEVLNRWIVPAGLRT